MKNKTPKQLAIFPTYAEPERQKLEPATREQVEAIYKLYPKRVGKVAALKAIELALRKVSFDDLREAVAAYAESRRGEDPAFTPYPATWFNAGRWEDDRTHWKRHTNGTGDYLAAWELSRKAVRRFGLQQRRDAMASLPPRIATVIDEIGWARFVDSPDLKALQARFAELWRESKVQ